MIFVTLSETPDRVPESDLESVAATNMRPLDRLFSSYLVQCNVYCKDVSHTVMLRGLPSQLFALSISLWSQVPQWYPVCPTYPSLGSFI